MTSSVWEHGWGEAIVIPSFASLRRGADGHDPTSPLGREGKMVVHTCLPFTGKKKKVDMAPHSFPLGGRSEVMVMSNFSSLGGGATPTSIFHSCANEVKVEGPHHSPF